MRPLPFRFLCLLGFLALAVARAGAETPDRIWAGLVLASEAKTPRPAPAELGAAATRICRAFGYNQVELIGSAAKEFDETQEHWLVPSQHFWMSVQGKHAFENGYLLDVSLFHDTRQLAEMQAKVTPETPLIVRGPLHARGQLIFVVQLLR